MIYKEIIGNELYVYMDGSLLYKRWLNRNYGMVFCPIFRNFTSDDTESFVEHTKKITKEKMKNYLNIGEMIDTEEKAELFRQTIENIKKLELNGDTAEVMLYEAGVVDEVFSFLIGQERYLTAEKVWSDIYKKDDLAHDNFDDYFNEQFLTEL